MAIISVSLQDRPEKGLDFEAQHPVGTGAENNVGANSSFFGTNAGSSNAGNNNAARAQPPA
jgi:hypothetical protein